MSRFFGNRLQRFLVMAPEGDGSGGGGGAPDAAKELADLKAANDAMKKELEGLKAKPAPKPDDPDLAAKAKAEREAAEKGQANEQAIENAVTFNTQTKEFVKSNASLLPKSFQSILDTADKEKYDSVVDKSNAIKVGFIGEFFSQQANLDLLTASQKNQIADFLKLTNTGKQEKAALVFENIFEPAFEMMKRVKRAEERGKGQNVPSDADAAYRDRLMKGSKKHYLGEKENA